VRPDSPVRAGRAEWICGCRSEGGTPAMHWSPCDAHAQFADLLDESKSQHLLAERGGDSGMRFSDYVVSWSFDPLNSYVERTLRDQYLSILNACGKPASDFFAAELIYRELISNALRHAPGTVNVELEWSQDHPVLSIDDQWDLFLWSGGPPVNVLNEHGRGLYLVNFFARELRIKDSGGFGYKVSAVLPVERKHDTIDLFHFPKHTDGAIE
jgi:two-component sensor histidine kinase